jgi:hypothetical protein
MLSNVCTFVRSSRAHVRAHQGFIARTCARWQSRTNACSQDTCVRDQADRRSWCLIRLVVEFCFWAHLSRLGFVTTRIRRRRTRCGRRGRSSRSRRCCATATRRRRRGRRRPGPRRAWRPGVRRTGERESGRAEALLDPAGVTALRIILTSL